MGLAASPPAVGSQGDTVGWAVADYAFLSSRELWYFTNSSLSSDDPLSDRTLAARSRAAKNVACAAAFPLPGAILQAR